MRIVFRDDVTTKNEFLWEERWIALPSLLECNFFTATVGALNTSLEVASKTTDIETEIVPFIIDSESDKVNTAAAVSGGVLSLEHGIAYCSDYGELHDELEQIKEEEKEKAALTQPKSTEPKLKE